MHHLILLLLLLRPLQQCAQDTAAAAVYTSPFALPAYEHRAAPEAAARARLAARAAAALASLQPLLARPSQAHLLKVVQPDPPEPAPPPRVLVVYAYSDSPCQRRNLAHFLRHGLAPALADGTPVDYSFVLQGRNPTDIFRAAGVAHQVAHIDPGRARARTQREHAPLALGDFERAAPLVRLYLLSEQPGGDAAAHLLCAAWRVLQEAWVPSPAPGAYVHFALLSGAARGPFLPGLAGVLNLNWLDIALHALLTTDPAYADVHAVGASIDCVSGAAAALAAQAARGGASNATAPPPTSPFPALHLHATVLALDAQGLAAASPHLNCYATPAEAQWQGVVGLTQGVLAGGGKVLALEGLWGGRALGLGELRSAYVAARCGAAAAAGGDTAAPGALPGGGSLGALEAMFVPCGGGRSGLEGLEGERELDRLSALADAFAPPAGGAAAEAAAAGAAA